MKPPTSTAAALADMARDHDLNLELSRTETRREVEAYYRSVYERIAKRSGSSRLAVLVTRW